MSTPSLDVVVCDDHRLFVDGLAALLRARGHRVVGATCRPSDAVAAVLDHGADICTMDLSFPRGNGLRAQEAIEKIVGASDTKVVVLSGHVSPMVRRAAIDAGASAVLDKAQRLDAVLDAVERVAAGEEVEIDLRDNRRSREPWTAASLAQFLTPREREVLEGLVRGESTAELAARLGVRPATARTHVQNLLAKLCVHSRLEAVALAVQHHLVDVA